MRSAELTTVRFVRDDAPDWLRIEAQLDGTHHVSETGAVTLVGPVISADPELVHRVATEAVGRTALYASASAITVEIAPGRVDDLTRSLHHSLVVR